MIKNFNTISVIFLLIGGIFSFPTMAYGRRPVRNGMNGTVSHRSGSINDKRTATTVRNNKDAQSSNRTVRPGLASTSRRPVTNNKIADNLNSERYKTNNSSRPGYASSSSSRRAETSHNYNNGNSSVNSNRGNTYVGNSHRGGSGRGNSVGSSNRNHNNHYGNGYRDYNYGYGSQSQGQGQGYRNQYQYQYQYGCNNNYYYNRYNRPYRNYGYYCPPPVRPYRPDFVHIQRPAYPYNYQPLSTAPVINGILGLTFGITSYVSSLDYLFSNNYYIDGYDNGYIYLRNVSNMGYYWDDVILNYSTMGYLSSTQFVKSYSYASNYMFNQLYNNLYYQYGRPVSYVSNMYGTTSTWYGRDGRTYLTLSYSSQYVNGYLRYYTTLTYTSC